MTTTGRFNSRWATRPRPVHVLTIAAVALIGSFQVCDLIGLRINASPSLPLGLYVTTNDSGADLVEFCPPEPFARLAAQRVIGDN
jgi:type IV secretory pathway protease TraF